MIALPSSAGTVYVLNRLIATHHHRKQLNFTRRHVGQSNAGDLQCPRIGFGIYLSTASMRISTGPVEIILIQRAQHGHDRVVGGGLDGRADVERPTLTRGTQLHGINYVVCYVLASSCACFVRFVGCSPKYRIASSLARHCVCPTAISHVKQINTHMRQHARSRGAAIYSLASYG